MADWDGYLENLEETKLKREQLAKHIQHNCYITSLGEDWQLPLFRRNGVQTIFPKLCDIDMLQDQSLLEDPAIATHVKLYHDVGEVAERAWCVWRSDFCPTDPDNCRLLQNIRSLDTDIWVLCGKIYDRRMKEKEYLSLLNNSHDIFEKRTKLEAKMYEHAERRASYRRSRVTK